MQSASRSNKYTIRCHVAARANCTRYFVCGLKFQFRIIQNSFGDVRVGGGNDRGCFNKSRVHSSDPCRIHGLVRVCPCVYVCVWEFVVFSNKNQRCRSPEPEKKRRGRNGGRLLRIPSCHTCLFPEDSCRDKVRNCNTVTSYGDQHQIRVFRQLEHACCRVFQAAVFHVGLPPPTRRVHGLFDWTPST